MEGIKFVLIIVWKYWNKLFVNIYMLIFNKYFIILIDFYKEGKVGGFNCNGYYEK